MIKPRKDLTGMIFGRLTVIEQVEDYVSLQGKHQTQWRCKCSCGNTEDVFATTNNLHNKHQSSCGCLRKECMKEVGKTNKGHNRCKFFQTYVIMYTSKNEEIYIDRQDYDKVKDYCWWITNKDYVVANNKQGRTIQIHRLIMDCPEELFVDHIGGYQTRNDNRRFNLRLATSSENSANKGLRKSNTSGTSGISWIESKQKWVVSIGFNGEIIALGHYVNYDDAVTARKKAEEELFGEWSYERSQEIYKTGLTKYIDDVIEDESMYFDCNLGYYIKRSVA